MPNKRSRKVLPLKPRVGGGMTGRDGAIDFAAKTAALNRMAVASADDHIYRVIELVGTSEESIEDAIGSAISRADKTLRNLRWFEVLRTSGHIVDGTVRHYQVTLKVGFTMEGPH
jgi:dodecin